jgi:hypothetical protein
MLTIMRSHLDIGAALKRAASMFCGDGQYGTDHSGVAGAAYGRWEVEIKCLRETCV